MANRPKVAHFMVNSALFEELGERLVSKPEVALAELVKNAYDADAKNCRLSVENDSITVADDGHGMTEKEFLDYWMVVSVQHKGKQRYSRIYSRAMAGSKGVGRFSVRFLGHAVSMKTTAWDNVKRKFTTLSATFDWQQLSGRKDIAELEVPYTVSDSAPSHEVGTVLTITKLRGESGKASISDVTTQVLKLTDPFAGLEKPTFLFAGKKQNKQLDPGFSVSVPNQNVSVANLQEDILKKFVGRVRITLDEDTLRYQVFWNAADIAVEDRALSIKKLLKPYGTKSLGKQGNSRSSEQPFQHLPVATTLGSPLFLDVRFFPGRPGTFAGLNVDGRVAQRWFRERASFSVVDNGFAMEKYVDLDADWLSISVNKARNERNWQSLFTSALYPMDPEEKTAEARNPMLALPNYQMILGRVFVATSRPPEGQANSDDGWLQPNMDREGLRENGAFRLLWHVTRFSVELLAYYDRKFRLEEEERKSKKKLAEAKSGLAKAITEIKSSKDINPEFRGKIASRLETVLDHYREQEDYEKGARASLELMALMGAMAGFMTHEFEKVLHTLGRAVDIIRIESKRIPSLAEHVEELARIEESLANFMDYSRAFIEKARDTAPQPFRSRAQLEQIKETLSSITTAHKIAVDIDVARSVIGPSVAIAAYNGIAINLLSNAIKALIPLVGTKPRKIRIHAYNEGPTHHLVVADTGIGIPEHLRVRVWDPLYTTTNHKDNPLGSGMGLGLSLVHRVIKNINGKIEIMETPPPGFVTAFHVSLPLEQKR